MSASAKCQPVGMSLVAIRASVAGGRHGLPADKDGTIVCGLPGARGRPAARVSGARRPSHDPAELGDDPDAETLGGQWADRLAHRVGEPLVASFLQGGPRWPGRSERPHRQVKVWPLIDDLRTSPLNEIQAGISKHLLSHPRPSCIALIEGGIDMARRRQFQ